MLTYKNLTGKIYCVTGLRVGTSTGSVEIGGNDNPVIRNPYNDEPYIPGSSIKGKVRSILEWALGKVSGDGKTHSCGEPDCPICNIFGISASNSIEADSNSPRIARAIFRDAFLTNNTKKWLKDRDIVKFTEIKYENFINRCTAKAENPRPIERIPAGAEFDFSLSFRMFKEDDKEYWKTLLCGLKLLENDSLGGCGSRGYGRIKFSELKDETGQDMLEQLRSINI
ncbi:CRISPR-associated RAMP protein, Csm3 family [Thermodesulfobium narugense DSM 14796]|uniref:CRISPR system Cms endoribonuclease Csm3 n=1 Tax=Thermodesulfobium narugense DSM 14796 TaxID=747365 RepID=M1E8T5_9BACT|nr:type III-A CRISPR-associated RAMP protein Csm3 [Thermodesulfobium narugense]AEE15338.1 CRISPR-associated RAMP protein, Csm3 family [Thermodesulfobium narugense DSM 14796]